MSFIADKDSALRKCSPDGKWQINRDGTDGGDYTDCHFDAKSYTQVNKNCDQ